MVDRKTIIIMTLIALLIGVIFYFTVQDVMESSYVLGLQQGQLNLMVQQLREQRCYFSNGTDIKFINIQND